MVRERLRRLGRRGWILAGLVAVVVVGGGGAGAWALTRDSTTATQTMTVQATKGTVKQTVSASGTVEAAQTADLDFAVSGTVTNVYVAAGDTVTEGEALAAVDNTALVAARTAAESALTAAQEQYDTDSAAGAAAVQVASDQAAVVSAKADLTSAKQAVKDAVLRSTIAGTVSTFDLTFGDVVGSGGSGGSGAGSSSAGGGAGATSSSASSSSSSTSAVEIVSTKAYIVDATVSADDATSVKKGLQATITVNGMTTPVYGTVATVGRVAQASSTGGAVFPVTIDVTGEVKGLYAGTTATAVVTVKQRTDVVTVMSRAIQSSGGSTYVMKVSGGKAVKTPVKIGEVYGMTTEITSGLASGDSVQVPGFTIRTGGTGGTNGNGETGRARGGYGGFGGSGFGGGYGGGGFGGGAPGGGAGFGGGK